MEFTEMTSERRNFFYQKVSTQTIHPTVLKFLSLGIDEISQIYFKKNKSENVMKILRYKPSNFFWSGCDLFKTENSMIVIETNSCPSGQKSMPIHSKNSYETLIKNSFLPFASKSKVEGDLAVIYDKNEMECRGYQYYIQKITGKKCHLSKNFSWKDGILIVNDRKISACFRYVTQKPWQRIPLNSKTLVYNSIICDLSGGRNKFQASLAYKKFEEIKVPETKLVSNRNSTSEILPERIIKDPYSNAGQGIYPIFHLQDSIECPVFDKFISQEIIHTRSKKRHCGLLLEERIWDLRMMICYDFNKEHFIPLVCYARKAASTPTKSGYQDKSQIMTNLSYKDKEGNWKTDTSRLITMSSAEFDSLGLTIFDLCESFIQTVASTVAIDLHSKNFDTSNLPKRVRLMK